MPFWLGAVWFNDGLVRGVGRSRVYEGVFRSDKTYSCPSHRHTRPYSIQVSARGGSFGRQVNLADLLLPPLSPPTSSARVFLPVHAPAYSCPSQPPIFHTCTYKQATITITASSSIRSLLRHVSPSMKVSPRSTVHRFFPRKRGTAGPTSQGKVITSSGNDHFFSLVSPRVNLK